MGIGGELTSLIKVLDFSSKQELLDKLRELRQEVKTYRKIERNQILPHLAIAIQQAFYCSEWELLQYKNFLTKRKMYGKKD